MEDLEDTGVLKITAILQIARDYGTGERVRITQPVIHRAHGTKKECRAELDRFLKKNPHMEGQIKAVWTSTEYMA